MQILWERLTNDLSDIFDAHGVCATSAQVIAMYTRATVITAISDPIQNHYDVWICRESGHTKQERWNGKSRVLDRIASVNRPSLLKKTAAPVVELVSDDVWQLVEKELLTCPLTLHAHDRATQMKGVLAVVDPGPSNPLEPQSIGSLAALIGVYLDRAFLRLRTDQQQVEFGTITDISYSITSTLNLNEIILQITDAVRRVLGTESLTIGLTNNNDEIIFVEALKGPAFRDMPPVRFEIGQGIAGWVAQHAEPVIVNDAYKDRRFSTKVDRDTGYLTNSVLCVPLIFEKRVIGVLEAINKQNGSFNENDSRLLQAISGPLAVAIENALLHSNVLAEKRRVDTIFSNLSEGLLTADGAGRITAANDALLSLLQKDSEDVVERSIFKVVNTVPNIFADFFERLMGGEDNSTQIACELLQGTGKQVPVLISGTLLQVERDMKEVILVFSDLRRIREVERMRDDFFNNIVHELRTPLATILMYARLLREGKAHGDPEKTNRFLGVIERESDRLQKMVWQMLQLAKFDSNKISSASETVAINHVLEQVLPPLADRATQKGLTFRQEIKPDLPPVLGSEESHHLILRNLIENAIKFTPSGYINITAYCDDDRVLIEIADQGIGIPNEALPNLFQRFYRAKTAVERGIAGTGLGLYMVKESLESFGGSIKVKSTEGKGTKFTIYLPISTLHHEY